jgi:DNA-binding NarL/FixJ family response regulator
VIRVCLVEDQTLVREGIRSLLALSNEIEIVGEAKDGHEAIQTIMRTRPDVVLLDMKLPRCDGLQVLRELNQQRQLPPTLILTTFDDDEILLGAMRAGARGFLLKDVTLKQLTEAIRTLHAGGTMFQPALTERVTRGVKQAAAAIPALDPMDPLTGREIQVLRFMAAGYSNQEIAGALDVAEGTVKNHVSSILSKMGVRDRTRAVLKAIERGLI